MAVDDEEELYDPNAGGADIDRASQSWAAQNLSGGAGWDDDDDGKPPTIIINTGSLQPPQQPTQQPAIQPPPGAGSGGFVPDDKPAMFVGQSQTTTPVATPALTAVPAPSLRGFVPDDDKSPGIYVGAPEPPQRSWYDTDFLRMMGITGTQGLQSLAAFGEYMFGDNKSAQDWFARQHKAATETIDNLRAGVSPEALAGFDASLFNTDLFGARPDASGKIKGPLEVGIGNYLQATGASLLTELLQLGIPGPAAGKVVGTVAAKLAPRVAGGTGIATSIATTGGVQGAMQAGASFDEIRTALAQLPEAQKQESPVYRQLRAQGLDDAQAVDRWARATTPFVEQFVLGAGTGILGREVLPGGALGRMATTRTGNAAIDAALGAAAFGGQAGGGTALQEQAKVEAGIQPAIDWSRVGTATGVGVGGGALLGGGFGLARTPRARPPAQEGASPAVVPPSDTTAPPANPTWPDLPPLDRGPINPTWPEQGPPLPSRTILPEPPRSLLGGAYRVEQVQPAGPPADVTAALNASGIGGIVPTGRGAVDTDPAAVSMGLRPRTEAEAIARTAAAVVPPEQRGITPTLPTAAAVRGEVLGPAIQGPAPRGPTPFLGGAYSQGPEAFSVGAPVRPPGPADFTVGAPAVRPAYRPGQTDVIAPGATQVPPSPAGTAPTVTPSALTQLPAPPARTMLPAPARTYGEGFTMEPEPSPQPAPPAPRQITASPERQAGPQGFERVGPVTSPELTTAGVTRGLETMGVAPERVAGLSPERQRRVLGQAQATAEQLPPRPSEGLGRKQLIDALVERGVPAQRLRAMKKDQLAAALDKLESDRDAAEASRRREATKEPEAKPRTEGGEAPAPTEKPAPTGRDRRAEVEDEARKTYRADIAGGEQYRFDEDRAAARALEGYDAAAAGQPLRSGTSDLSGFYDIGASMARGAERRFASEAPTPKPEPPGKARVQASVAELKKRREVRPAPEPKPTPERRGTTPRDIREVMAEAQRVPAQSAARPPSEEAPVIQRAAPKTAATEEIGPLAPSTTNRQAIGRNLERRVLAGEIEPGEAAELFPAGKTTELPTFFHYLRRELNTLHDPAERQKLFDRYQELESARGLSQQQRAAQRRSLDAELARFDPEHIQRLVTMLEDAWTQAAARTRREFPQRTERSARQAIDDDRATAPTREQIARLRDTPGGASAHDLLRTIANNSYLRAHAPQWAALARQLMRRLPSDLRVHSPADALRLYPQMQSSFAPAAYHYGFADSHGFIVARDTTLGSNPVEMILHEAHHALTSRYLDRLDPGSRAIKALDLIADELRQSLGTEDGYVQHALRNHHELHTILKTSPEVQRLASEVQPSAELVQGLRQLGYGPGPLRSLWQAFVRVVRQVVGLPQNYNSLLDTVMRPLDAISRDATRSRRFDDLRFAVGDRLGVNDMPAATPDAVARAIETDYQSASHLDFPSIGDGAARLTDLWDDRQAAGRGVWDWARPKLLQAATGDSIVARYAQLFTRDGRNLLAVERAARASTDRLAADVYTQYEGRAREAINGLRADPSIGTLLRDATTAEAYLGRDDPSINAHVDSTALADLERRFNQIGDAGQKTYRDTVGLFNDLYQQERTAKLEGVVGVLLPDAEPAARQQLLDALRTKSGTERLIDSPATLDRLAEALTTDRTIIRAIAQFHNMGFVRGDYFPLRRHGEFVVTYGDKQTNDYGVEMFENRRDAERRRTELSEQGAAPSDVMTKATSHMRQMATLANPILDELQRHVASRYGPEQAAAIHDMLGSIMLQHMTRSEATRTRLRRQGVWGASDDAPRVVAGDMLAAAYRIGYYSHGLERAAALRDMRLQVREIEQYGQSTAGLTAQEMEVLQGRARSSDNTAAAQARQVLQEIEKRQPQSDDPASRVYGRAVGRFTQASYIHSLLSFSQAMVNTAEAHMMGASLIGSRHGIGRAGVGLARAVAEMLPAGVGRIGSLSARSLGAWGAELRQADWNIGEVLKGRLVKAGAKAENMDPLFAALRENNLLDIGGTLTRDLQRIARPGIATSPGGRAFDRFMDFSSVLGHVSEETNKVAIAKTAFDLELRKTNDVNKAIDYALEQVRRAIPNYRNKSRLATAQGSLGHLGPAIMQFKNYGLHIYSLMSVLGKEALRGEGKWEARKALAGMLAMHSLAAGAFNWIADPLRYAMGAYDLITGAKRPHQYQHDLRGWASDALGPTWGEMFARGLPRAGGYGVDLGRRIGIANPLGMPDLEGFDAKAIASVAGTLMTGASGQTSADIVSSLSLATQGKLSDAVKALVPRSVRDVVQATQLTEGVKDPRGRVIVPPERLPPGAVVAKALGFNPAAVAEFREQRRAIVETRQEAQDARQEVYDAFAKATTGRERDAAMREVAQYNRANPSYPITFDQLMAQTRRLARQIANPATGGLDIPARRLAELTAAGRFANVR